MLLPLSQPGSKVSVKREDCPTLVNSMNAMGCVRRPVCMQCLCGLPLILRGLAYCHNDLIWNKWKKMDNGIPLLIIFEINYADISQIFFRCEACS